MKTRRAWLSALWLLPVPLLAQAPPVITMDQETHHKLAMKNNFVKVFEIELAPGDAIAMHRHDHDEVSIVLDGATIVSTTPGQADVLTIAKAGDVSFERSEMVHSIRNIGQTAFRSFAIDLQRSQAGARNLCGKQIPDLKPDCPAAIEADSTGPRVDLPQFETDQVRVTLTRVRPQQQAKFGESGRDDLIVTMDEAAIVVSAGKGAASNQTLASGSPVWIPRRGSGRVLKNISDKELRVLTIAFKP